jgi:protein-S-isoprenylcysteine O-methyltransferase Ste14
MAGRELVAKSDTAGVVAPPPLIFLGFLIASLAIDHFGVGVGVGAGTGLWPSARFIAAACLIIPAMVLIIGALSGFRAARTAARPWEPTTAIVSDGVYRFTRNPMYLAMAMLYASIALAADSVIALIALIPALIVMEIGVIRREERYLESKFGEDYLRYKAAVRRWI